MNSRLRWRSLTRAWTLPVSRSMPSQQADGAVALVFMIAGDSRVNGGRRRQVRGRHADRLHARLLVIGHDRDRVGRLRSLLQQLDLTIDAQHLGHFRRGLGIAAFQVVAQLVRLHLASIEYLADGSLRQIGQAGVPGCRSVWCTPKATPTAKNNGSSRYANSIRARQTRPAGSVREREMISSSASSSS
jgi:hypothetical protein